MRAATARRSSSTRCVDLTVYAGYFVGPDDQVRIAWEPDVRTLLPLAPIAALLGALPGALLILGRLYLRGSFLIG